MSLPVAAVFAINGSLVALGLILLILPTTVRQDLSSYRLRHFPIYPDGRPTSGSSKAPYFPTHIDTTDNTMQIVLGGAALLYGSISTSLLYFQCTRPVEFSKPIQKIAGWVAMIVAGTITALTAIVATWLSFDGNRDGSNIDLTSVGYWPWQNMFPTIQWSIEGWTCKVYEQLSLPSGTDAAYDFEQMCEYSRVSKWLALVLLFLGISATIMGCAALAEQRCLDRCEKADLRVEALRESEKIDKRSM